MKKNKIGSLTLLSLCLLAPNNGHAQVSNLKIKILSSVLLSKDSFAKTPIDCSPSFKSRHAYVVKANSGQKIHFQTRFQKCDKNAECTEQKMAYLISGDRVVAEEVGGNAKYICATYVSKKGSLISGWLPVDHVQVLAGDTKIKLIDLIGHWKSVSNGPVYEGSIVIKEGGKTWSGSATYKENDGEFSGKASANGAVIKVKLADDDSCELTARWAKPYLLVDDNGDCGGLNVTFSGSYVRLTKKGKAQ